MSRSTTANNRTRQNNPGPMVNNLMRDTQPQASHNQLSLEEELEHQIKKSDLLDKDRYSFYMKAEETKSKNKDIIDQMKRENDLLKKLRDDLQRVKKGPGGTNQMNKTAGSNMMLG